MKQVRVIFDIGKTNKKCFVFGENYRELTKYNREFDEVEDEDGFPCDDLFAIEKWIDQTLKKIADHGDYRISGVNFSTYGATLVHLDGHGRPVTPLYNYLKPLPANVLEAFYEQYGAPEDIARQTASPPAGMLNSGWQLYWLKHTKPEQFQQIRRSLHFPQYLSYRYTGIMTTDYTSLGCHTGLYDFEKKDYHDWVYAENLVRLFPPLVSTETVVRSRFGRRMLNFGIGIHDSSAALLPYLRATRKPFALISTGTWSIALNPFATEPLTPEDLRNDTLNYLRIDGRPVRATRLFLGKEYATQVARLNAYFLKKPKYHRKVKLNNVFVRRRHVWRGLQFKMEHLPTRRGEPAATDLTQFKCFEEAYHQLMVELTDWQAKAIRRAVAGLPWA